MARSPGSRGEHDVRGCFNFWWMNCMLSGHVHTLGHIELTQFCQYTGGKLITILHAIHSPEVETSSYQRSCTGIRRDEVLSLVSDHFARLKFWQEAHQHNLWAKIALLVVEIANWYLYDTRNEQMFVPAVYCGKIKERKNSHLQAAPNGVKTDLSPGLQLRLCSLRLGFLFVWVEAWDSTVFTIVCLHNNGVKWAKDPA